MQTEQQLLAALSRLEDRAIDPPECDADCDDGLDLDVPEPWEYQLDALEWADNAA